MPDPVVIHSCCVCALLEDDYSEKPTRYCGFCKAYLCEPHLRSPARLQAWYEVKKGRRCP